MEQNNFNGFNMNEPRVQDTQNPMTGILGAFLGAVVGSIPWIVVARLGFFIGWLAFVIGIASVKGYIMFKGPKNYGFARTTIWVTSILVILLANFVDIAIVMITGGIPFTIGNLMYFMGILMSNSSYMMNIAISLVIGVLGLTGIGRRLMGYIYS